MHYHPLRRSLPRELTFSGDAFSNVPDEELEKMRSKAEALFTRAGDIKVEVENAELNGRERKREVENWLQKVENVKDQVRGGASSSRTVPNVRVAIAKITKEIDELLQHSLPRELTFSNVPFVTGSLKGHLFEENRKLILSLLDDDDVATIGIHGAGGIGKTTLVAHVQKGLCEKFNNDRCSGNVYFVTVSHGLTVSGLQSKIANQLGLKIEGADVMKAAAMIHRAFMKRKYSVLILDDLWESFRPIAVGLPVGKSGFKLLLTTRNKRVCLDINNEKSRIIEVKCLSDDESWDLFRENLGDSAILSQAGDIARKVAKKCMGLPLALEHVAISMRFANTVEDWRTVLADMSSIMLEVVEDKVLPLLQYSYDRLRDQQLKDCFLYCSLFPEDHWIYRTELVDIWIREGLLDGKENRERQRDKGFRIFMELINLSLLEADGNNYWSAKMHNLVREMAVKVGKEKGFLIRAGEKMRDIPGEQEWNEDLCKVSLMYNDIGSISPDVQPMCPNLSTLVLSCNGSLTSISSLFFSLMDGLCVLDLSRTGIEKLPDSVSNLKNLTALLLYGCGRLNYVPSVSMLRKLREMDISYCWQLRDLPHGMEGLVNLKFLDSVGCPAPVSGILSGLSHLEESRICDSSEAKGQDLMKLMHLKRLSCRIRNVSEFNEYVMSQCFASLHQYNLTVGQGRLDDNFSMNSVKFVECRFEEDSPIVPGNVERLHLVMCSGVEYLVSSASPDSTFIPLQTLGNLVELFLVGLENFKGLVKPGVALPPGSLSNLKRIWIRGCHGIKKLFTSSMLRGNLQNLEYLHISECGHLEEVIGGSDSDNDDDEYRDDYGGLATSVVRLRIYFLSTAFTLSLAWLPNFKRVIGRQPDIDLETAIEEPTVVGIDMIGVSSASTVGEIEADVARVTTEASTHHSTEEERTYPVSDSATASKSHTQPGQTSKQDSEVLDTKESLPGLGDSTHMMRRKRRTSMWTHMMARKPMARKPMARKKSLLERKTPQWAISLCRLDDSTHTMKIKMARKPMARKKSLLERKTSQPLIDLDTVIEEPTKVSIDPVNLQLRFVFDRLEAPDLKFCFLCCALFPEYEPIDVSKLVNYFIDEGLLIGAKVTAFERGLDIVWRLADASLLEVAEDNSTVKMHELTRGLALAILSSEAELCQLLLRSEVKLSQPRTTEKKTVQSLENSPRAFETVEGPGTSLILSSESREFITLAGAELKEPPVEEEWEEARMIILSGNKLSRLPARPMCNRLSVLLLQRNYSLRVIPSSFFDFMPSLQILDLSKTKIKSLPQSFTKLGSLQVLLLRDCVRLMVFPPEIGSLKRLEVLDLHGTEITQLPDTVSKLSSLRHLQLSFYGSDIRSDYVKLPTTLIPDGIIRNLNLTELGISMFPGDHRWFSSALGVTKEVSCLELNALSFPFPDMNHLRHLIEESLSWKHGTLRKYNFVVGRDVKRIVSQVSSDVELMYSQQDRCLRFVNVELMYSQQDRCLRFVNGEEEPRNPDAILEVVKQATAFYMDHCVGICFLSEFGISNLRELKLCIVRDCPNFESLVNDDEFQGSILPDLETLSLNYLWNLKKIWIGRVPTGSLSHLRHLSVRACPHLTSLFTSPMIETLSCLEELVVEDCESLKNILSEDEALARDSRVDSSVSVLHNLKMLKLQYLPALSGIWEGPWPRLKYISVYACPALQNLRLDSVAEASLREIKAEGAWWSALKWDDPAFEDKLQGRVVEIHNADV